MVLWLVTSCHFTYSSYFVNTNFILVVLNSESLLIPLFSSQHLWPCGEYPSQAVLMGANFWWTQEETTHPDRSIQACVLDVVWSIKTHSCSFAAVCAILLPHTIAAVWMWCIILDLVSEHQSLATKLPCINMVKVRAFISFFVCEEYTEIFPYIKSVMEDNSSLLKCGSLSHNFGHFYCTLYSFSGQ